MALSLVATRHGKVDRTAAGRARITFVHTCCRGADSRHQAALGGHGRTLRSGNLSSGGHLRSRRDNRGHVTNTVRDREAPVSTPGPPTTFDSLVAYRTTSARPPLLPAPATLTSRPCQRALDRMYLDGYVTTLVHSRGHGSRAAGTSGRKPAHHARDPDPGPGNPR